MSAGRSSSAAGGLSTAPNCRQVLQARASVKSWTWGEDAFENAGAENVRPSIEGGINGHIYVDRRQRRLERRGGLDRRPPFSPANDTSAIADIGAAGAYTVTIASTETFTVDALTVDDASAVLAIDGGLTVASDLTSGAAPATWTGAANLGGDALLEFASGQITSIAAGAQLTLDNINAPSRVADASDMTSNSALTQLASNAGTFELLNGNGLADQATSTLTNSGSFSLGENTTFSTLSGVGFTNSGGFGIDTGSGQGGSTVTIGGALINSGGIQIGVGYASLNTPAPLSASTTVTAASLINAATGTIDLYGNWTEGTTNQATLEVNGSVTTSGTIILSGLSELAVSSGNVFAQTAGTTTVNTGGTLAAGTIDVAGGLLDFTSAIAAGSGTGNFDIGGAGIVEFGGAVDAGHSITFTSAAGVLDLGVPGQFAPTIVAQLRAATRGGWL